MVKRIIGILVFVIGIALLFGAKYIRDEVGLGKEKVNNAQKKVDEGTGIFNINPITKQIGKSATSAVQKKIDEGVETIEHYEMIAQWLQIGGIVCLIGGVAIVFLGGKKKK